VLIEDVRDNASPNMTSACCGSAAKLPTGNWVMSWGQNALMTELTPAGDRAAGLTFGVFSYRADPILAGTLTRAQLRAGMDAQYPRTTSTPTPTPTATPTPMPTSTPTPTPTPTPALVSISGAVAYCSTSVSVPVPHVKLNLTGDQSGTTLSDDSGGYQFLNLATDGFYMVTPTKDALLPGAPAIDTIDVVATQRHFLTFVLLPPGCRQTAADTNGDGVIDTIDVIAIQRFFLGLSTGIAKTGQYNFSPSNRAYLSLHAADPNQNYITLVFGDVASPFAAPRSNIRKRPSNLAE
jgi:hypothetical protein